MATLQDAKQSGLFHPNCRHSVTPYVPGTPTRPAPTSEEQKQGKEMYEQKQRLNQINRNIRKWQDRKVSLANVATPEEMTRINNQIKQWRKMSTDYAKTNNLKNYTKPKVV